MFFTWSSSFAAATANNESMGYTIKNIETSWSKDGYLVRVNETNTPSPVGCGVHDFKLMIANNVMHREILSLALSAMHAGSKVTFRVEDDCINNRHEIIAIQIVK